MKSFVAEKGWGMITCAQTHQSFNKDMFFMKSDVQGAASVSAGNQVSFSVVTGAKGPQASNVQLQGSGAGRVHSRAPAVQTQFSLPAPQAQQGQYMGTVKSWSPEKGWGMIQCPQTHLAYGKDMFFMKTAITGGAAITPGLQVMFSVEQGAKGPQGAHVRLIGGGSPAMQHVMQAPVMQALQVLHAHGVGGVSPVGQTFCGFIKSYDETKGWGFISCDGTQALYGKDIFMLKTTLQGHACEIGDQVAFSVKMGRKGPEAEQLTVLPMGSFGTEESAGAVFSGTVKSYNETKGWGFIDCEDAKTIFNKDIFLHKRECSDTVPKEGDPVQFSVNVSASGKPEAATVSFGRYAAIKTITGGKGVKAGKGGKGGKGLARPSARPSPY